MSDLDLVAGRPRAVAARTVVLVAAAIVVVPMLLLYGYLLLWFSPEVTGTDVCLPEQAACRLDDGKEIFWLLVFAASGTAMVAYALAWWRRRRAGRWWPWPVLSLVLVAAAIPAMNGLV
jgi:formate hydrogenlyase subunit 3/multisubunit Na+/H+ antiporter MnhD subunit